MTLRRLLLDKPLETIAPASAERAGIVRHLPQQWQQRLRRIALLTALFKRRSVLSAVTSKWPLMKQAPVSNAVAAHVFGDADWAAP